MEERDKRPTGSTSDLTAAAKPPWELAETVGRLAIARVTVHRRANPVGLMGQTRVEGWQGCTAHQTSYFPLEPLKQSCGVAHAR